MRETCVGRDTQQHRCCEQDATETSPARLIIRPPRAYNGRRFSYPHKENAGRDAECSLSRVLSFARSLQAFADPCSLFFILHILTALSPCQGHIRNTLCSAGSNIGRTCDIPRWSNDLDSLITPGKRILLHSQPAYGLRPYVYSALQELGISL